MTLAELRKKQGEPVEGGEHESAHGEHHPGAMEYLQIGAILTIITAVEVALYYIDMNRTLLLGLLGILSVVKFTMVVMWFMHLKFDNRLFSILFATGLFGTVILFAVVIGVSRGKLVEI